MSVRSELTQLLANLHGCEYASVEYLKGILRDNPVGIEETQWAWKRVQLHAAASEEEAREMVEMVGGAVMKRTVTFGRWEEAK